MPMKTYFPIQKRTCARVSTFYEPKHAQDGWNCSSHLMKTEESSKYTKDSKEGKNNLGSLNHTTTYQCHHGGLIPMYNTI